MPFNYNNIIYPEDLETPQSRAVRVGAGGRARQPRFSTEELLEAQLPQFRETRRIQRQAEIFDEERRLNERARRQAARDATIGLGLQATKIGIQLSESPTVRRLAGRVFGRGQVNIAADSAFGLRGPSEVTTPVLKSLGATEGFLSSAGKASPFKGIRLRVPEPTVRTDGIFGLNRNLRIGDADFTGMPAKIGTQPAVRNVNLPATRGPSAVSRFSTGPLSVSKLSPRLSAEYPKLASVANIGLSLAANTLIERTGLGQGLSDVLGGGAQEFETAAKVGVGFATGGPIGAGIALLSDPGVGKFFANPKKYFKKWF